jgi:hypothetical protein
MEHYFSLHGITDELGKIVMVFSIWILNTRNGGNGVERHAKSIFLGKNLMQSFMNALTLTPTI